MRYTIDVLNGYLKAEMVERDTAEETKQFVEAILAALRAHPGLPLLISIRSSRPVYKVEGWDLSGVLGKVAGLKTLKVAFIADTRELAMSQQYIELLARQRGLNFRTFDAEAAATAWLLAAG